MSGKNTAVFGIYSTHESADAAVDTLRAKGFRNTDVSVLFPQNLGSKEFGHEKGTKSAEGAVAEEQAYGRQEQRFSRRRATAWPRRSTLSFWRML